MSAYASVHPWEDWAETMAHYFHITDSLETASGFGMSLQPRHPSARMMSADARNIGRGNTGFEEMLDTWFPLTYALNSLNRGMGLPDLYPFVLSQTAVSKLRFVHDVVEREPFNKLHHEVVMTIGRAADIDGLHDVVVRQSGRRPSLFVEPVDEFRVAARALSQLGHGPAARRSRHRRSIR